MNDLTQEIMTPYEAAKWFRRSPSWLRLQTDLLRLGGNTGQPLFHVRVCRAFVFGRLIGLTGEPLRQLQLQALAAACGLPPATDCERPPADRRGLAVTLANALPMTPKADSDQPEPRASDHQR